ncbi:sigma-70 family RNA polymerase sigma factor [Prevotella disiens]|nr:RNA polymerase sigma factor RpoD/SigA [Prevotella disiens]KGF50409.1 RNA polymerase sigma factor rpoD [Prevotella disiens DNF00882]
MRQLKITKSITNRESTALEKYLQDISREAMVGLDEEIELAKRIREGDEKALERLTKANLRFVVSVAKQYQNQGLALPDLINEGNFGLIKAAQKYDETRGFKFISYAVWWIRQSIMQAISEQSRMVRVPINQMGSANRIRKFINQFEQEHERYPSLSELTEHIDLPEEKIVEALAMATTQVSMDAPFTSNEEGSLLDVLPNKNAPSADDLLVAESLSTEVANALASLSEREQIIIKCFFGINQPEMSLEEIGERTGLTRERVRQIKEKAIIRLRKNSLSERLKSFLGK